MMSLVVIDRVWLVVGGHHGGFRFGGGKQNSHVSARIDGTGVIITR